jgi:VanZ family protein
MARLLFDRRARLVCGALWGVAWLVVTALLLLPLEVAEPEGSDLVAHGFVFGTMAFAAVGFSRRPRQLAWLAAATIALGAALEYAQGFVPYRTSAVADVLANGVGGVVGFAAALLVLYRVIRPAEAPLGAAP